MLIDARTLPKGGTIDTEVCIVGTGPAGLTLAHEFIEQDFRVCLLESGGLEPDEETQSLCVGETAGDTYSELDILRRRQCGGTANDWTVQIAPGQAGVRYGQLDEVDFEKRDWLPYSGWPFDLSYLEPFYERAQSICQAGPFAYDADAWEDAQTPQLPFIGNRVKTTMFQFGPSAAFYQEHRDQASQASNITIYLNANVVELETDETAKTVTRVRVACLSGNEFWVSAKIVILATGGIENARLLLLSNQTQKTGLGNQNDLVGRFFMDHPLVRTGEFIPSNRNIFNSTALYDRRRVNNTPVMGKLALTNEVMRDEQVLNMSAMLYPRYPHNQPEAVRSLKKLLKSLGRAKLPEDALKHFRNVSTGVGDIVAAAYTELLVKPFRPDIPGDLPRGGWSEWENKERKFGYFEVYSQTEQAPDPDNRVMLSDQLDRLGCPKVKLHWRWREIDTYNVKRAQQILAEEIARSELGQLQIDRDGEKPFLLTPTTHHHIGTTRMHTDPKQGVVDENCQVHGVSNVFIAGSSVFPTGGYGNPTLTIVALAVRLADQVKQTMALSRITVSKTQADF